MKKQFLILLTASLSVLFTGCMSMQSTDSKLNSLAVHLALLAPANEEEAKDGSKELSIPTIGIPGIPEMTVNISIKFTGLWLDGDTLRADSVTYDGLYINYSASPFAWNMAGLE